MAELIDLAGRECAIHPGSKIIVGSSGKVGVCGKGCKTKELKAYALSLNGHIPKKEDPPKAIEGSGATGKMGGDGLAAKELATPNGILQGPYYERRVNLPAWRERLFSTAFHLLRNDERFQAARPAAEFLDTLIEDVRSGVEMLVSTGNPPPIGLSETDIQEECGRAAKMALEDWAGGIDLDRALPIIREPNKVSAVEDFPDIPWEDFAGAVVANEDYLKRTAVVDRLLYSSAVSMITGGKHAGKSTLARWMAVCVAKGWPVIGREVTQGQVYYIASEDETMAARQEIIRLGWNQDDPLRFLTSKNIKDPSTFLPQLTHVLNRTGGAALIVLDMLFDFVTIADEMSYAGTREALGKIQNVASETGTHIIVIHHAPKYADSAADAGVTALGSQGLAARVSPIILVRRHGPGVHSISSTSVRDPRGEALIESKLVKNVDGSVTLGGGWKMWMQAEVFAPRVLELLQTEPGQELTAGDVKDALGISYQLASGSLSRLAKEGAIHRSGEGRKGKPFRYSADAADSSATNGPIIHHGGDLLRNQDESFDPNDGRFGYKDN